MILYLEPLRDSVKLIFTQGRDSRKRTYLFFINEAYRVMIMDFTDAENNQVQTKLNLDMIKSVLPFVGKVSINDLFWNELTNVDTNNTLFMYPCISKGRKFITWFKLTQVGAEFNVKIFASPATDMQIDRIGRNSYIVFPYLSHAFVLSSGVDTKEWFTLTVLDLSKINENIINEKYFGNYTSSDFSYILDGK